MTNKRIVRIGCSGYYYPTWRNAFYPAGVPTSRWLEHYSSIFNSVELNGSFYRLPKLAALQKSHRSTPDNFSFSVKASRYITHILRLKGASLVIADFCSLMEEGLQDKLDRILFQMPPTFKFSPENLELIVKSIPANERNVIELRHKSWWNPEVRATLKAGSITFCNVSFPGLPERYISTTKSFYLRMHGVPELFKSSYTRNELKGFYERFPKRAEQLNIYFNNTWFDAAYKNALIMQKMCTKL